MKPSNLLLGPHIQAFFTEHLCRHKRTSQQTIARLRDSFRLLLDFLRTCTGKEPCSLLITDLDVTAILAFLDHLEEKRGNKVRSRNLRLAAIRTFFRFVALRDPERLGQVTQIMAIPVKRQEKRLISGPSSSSPLSSLVRIEDYAELGTKTRSCRVPNHAE